MAKLHKVSMFVLDIGEEYEYMESLIEHLFDRTKASAHFVELDTSQFPWYDGIILNSVAATKEDYDTFMDTEKRRKLQMTKAVEFNHGDIKEYVKNVMEDLGLPTSDEDMVEFLRQVSCHASSHAL